MAHKTESYVAAHVARARKRERARTAARVARVAAARVAGQALRARYGSSVEVYVFGSVLDPGRFRLDSDIDLAIRGLPTERYYEAWRVAEAAAGAWPLDLIRLEDAPAWLVEEVAQRGEAVP